MDSYWPEERADSRVPPLLEVSGLSGGGGHSPSSSVSQSLGWGNSRVPMSLRLNISMGQRRRTVRTQGLTPWTVKTQGLNPRGPQPLALHSLTPCPQVA